MGKHLKELGKSKQIGIDIPEIDPAYVGILYLKRGGPEYQWKSTGFSISGARQLGILKDRNEIGPLPSNTEKNQVQMIEDTNV